MGRPSSIHDETLEIRRGLSQVNNTVIFLNR